MLAFRPSSNTCQSVAIESTSSKSTALAMDCNQELYQALPLQAGQIRLLHLRPSRDLSFDLIRVDLKDKPKYAWLSCTWGTPIFNRVIRVNDCDFHITESLHVALLQLQQGITSRTVKWPLERSFWIDAICIDQNDSTEKSAQVGSMANIYEHAHRIYVWLGPAKNADRDRAAVAKMRYLAEEIASEEAKSMKSYKFLWRALSPSYALGNCLRLMDDLVDLELKSWSTAPSDSLDAWMGIGDIFRSPWWTRAWAHQEGTVPESDNNRSLSSKHAKPPKSRVRFVSGDACTKWYALQMVMDVGVHLRQGRGHVPPFDLPLISACRVLQIRRMRSLNKPLTLFNTINSFRQAACQDPRDKVFAALGLVAPAFRTTLQPDYKSSTADVYTELVKYFLNTKHDAYEFLGYACEADDAAEFLSDNDSLRSLPSWVPNWRVPLTITPLPKQIHIQASDSSYGRLKSLFRDPEEIKQRTSERSAHTTHVGATLPQGYLSTGTHCAVMGFMLNS